MPFLSSYEGELYALLTAVFWTVTAIAFESASHKVGSLAVNIIRLFIAFAFLAVYGLFTGNGMVPSGASMHNWTWLLISGMIGFVLGDLFLFKSYTLIGSRNAMLIMSLVPALTAVFAWIILGEILDPKSLLGMGVTLFGISLAIFNKPTTTRRVAFRLPLRGLLYAFAGAVGQALGLVISKYGMQGYDAFASNQIRIIAGMAGFSVLVTFLRRWDRVGRAMLHPRGMTGITTGAFFGPFLGVSFSLLAVAHTQTGIASTIMALVPVFILVPARTFLRQQVTAGEVTGAVISFIGVSIFFIF